MAGPHSVAFWLVHARTTVLRPRGCFAPYASFQREDTCVPTGNISGDIRRVVELCTCLNYIAD